jgi:hypothetical protein
MEGASQISPENKAAMYYGSELWQSEGRGFITSDVKAVCEAANAFGIDEIVLNDDHDYGHKDPNIRVDELPGNIKMVRRPHLPGTPRKAVQKDPFGMIAGYYYDPNSFSKMSGIMFYLFTRLYRGKMNPNEAWWETNTINKGLYALEFARQFMKVEK